MRLVKEIKEEVPEGVSSKDPAPLKVKEVFVKGKRFALRTECLGTCGKVFQAVGVAIPPTIREL